jgi:TolB-like protein/Tfp pilus assembly protein PilF
MPFANLSADPENAYFADGMTEEVINALSGIEGLRVAARSSVFALRGKQLDVRMIGDTLGVGSVLEGTVRRQGNRLRITAQLVSSKDGYQVWSDDYDRELSDVFQVQNEIARSIVTALRVKLIRTTAGPASLAKPTGNAEAYDLYLKGLYLLHSQGVNAVRTALQHFEAALALDPDFARAHSGVAAARARLGVLAGQNPAVELPLAKKSALRALQLDSSLAEAHVSLAHVLFVWEWNHREAERVFLKAISLDPDDADARWHYGISLLNQKRFADAERQFRTAHDLEPLVPHTSSLLGRFFVATRNADSAIKYLKNAIELGPSLDLAYQQLGHAYLQKDMAREAITAFAKAAELSGPRDSAHLAHAYAITGNRQRAELILSRLLATASTRYLFPVDLALPLASLGRKDEAFTWLERGLRDHAPFMDNIHVFPGLEPLRADARFADIVARMETTK